MTNREFVVLMQELDATFRGELDKAGEGAMRQHIGRVSFDEAHEAIAVLVARGQVFMPVAAEMVGALTRDPSRPTFEEAFAVLYERPRSPLKKSTTKAAVAKAMEHHPLIARFVQVLGRDYLARLEVFDVEWGGAKRQQLLKAWNDMVAATGERDVTALVESTRDGGRTRRLDPMKAIGAERRELGPGPSSPEGNVDA